jgi:hypothetical protein
MPVAPLAGFRTEHLLHACPKFGNPKLDSQLSAILTSAQAANKPIPLPKGVPATSDGRLILFLVPGHGQPASSIDLPALAALGGEVLAQSQHLVRVALPLSALEAATSIAGVNFIQPPIRPQRQAVVSEGVTLINAAANQARNVTGAGVRVGIIDDSFADADQLTAQDRPVFWYRDFTGSGMYSGNNPHGTACTEIVYDVAPGAELSLYRIGDLLDLENAKDACIRDTIAVVNHSMGWLGTGFGDGQGRACTIVDDAAAHGVLWVNSGGNYANRQYTGLWADKDSDGWHNFAGDYEVLDLVQADTGDSLEVWLTWMTGQPRHRTMTCSWPARGLQAKWRRLPAAPTRNGVRTRSSTLHLR